MAESQVPYTYNNSGELKSNLSEERFKPFLMKAGFNEEYAFNLYLYNARLAKSFLYPLHILEVTLRNKMSGIFSTLYGPDWPRSTTFRGELSQQSEDALDKGIQRAKSHDTEDIVATLTFDFWSNLFRSEYDRPFWQSNMQTLLPNTTKTRHEFQQHVKDLNRFRNRVAHHEPIYGLNISKYHTELLDVIKWISKETHDWTKHHSTVNGILRTSPSANGEPKPHFGERCDNQFWRVDNTTTLNDIPSCRFYYYDGDVPLIIEKSHLLDFMLRNKECDGTLMLDLTEITFGEIISTLQLPSNAQRCGSTESLIKAKQIFKQRGIDYIIVEEASNVVGIIAKAHRQY